MVAHGAMTSCTVDCRNPILQVSMKIAADVAAISPLVEWVMQLLMAVRCGSGKEFEIETSLREALANAIVHGCKQDSDKAVELGVVCDESRGIIITVRDPGNGFDPEELPSPVTGQTLHSNHGRGIYLINQLMDKVHIERKGTEIRMEKGSSD